jgi:hypothetical protein
MPDSTPTCYLKYNLSRVGDAFDFKPELTSEPTTAEGRPIIDCEGYAYVADQLGGSGDDGSIPTETLSFNFDHLSVPNANAEVDGRDFLVWQRGTGTTGLDDGSIPTETLSLNFDKITFADGGSIDDFAVDQTNPNVEWPIGPIPSVQDDGLLLPC